MSKKNAGILVQGSMILIYAGSDVIVATDDGIYISRDSGKTYKENSLKNFNVTCVEYFDTTIYAGTDDGRFLISHDGSRTWTNNKSLIFFQSINDILVTDSLIFAGTELGIHRSKRDKIAFLRLGNTNQRLARITALLYKNGRVIAGGNSGWTSIWADEMILESGDLGDTWNGLSNGIFFAGQITDLEFIGNKIFLSHSATGISTITLDNQVMNKPLKWSSANEGLVSRNETNKFSFDGRWNLYSFKGTLYAHSGLYGLFQFSNYESWDRSATNFKYPVHGLTKHQNLLLATTRDGIKSQNHPDSSWKHFSNIVGYQILSNDSLIIVDSNKNVLSVSNDHGKTWTRSNGQIFLDGRYFLFGNSLLAAQSVFGPDIRYSDDFGLNWFLTIDGIPRKEYPDRDNNTGSIHYDGEFFYTSSIYEGSLRIPFLDGTWESHNQGIAESQFLFWDYFQNGNDLITASNDHVYLSKDRGLSWIQIDDGLPVKNDTFVFTSFEEHDAYLYLLGNRIWRRPMEELTGIKDMEERNEIFIYPNPSSGIINIEGIYKRSTLEVYDVLGNLLLSKNLGIENKNTKLDLSSHSAGIYIVKIQINNGLSYSHKIMLQ